MDTILKRRAGDRILEFLSPRPECRPRDGPDPGAMRPPSAGALRIALGHPRLCQWRELELVSRGLGSLTGEKANGIRDLAGVGEGLRCDALSGFATHGFDPGVYDQQGDMDAAWAQL